MFFLMLVTDFRGDSRESLDNSVRRAHPWPMVRESVLLPVPHRLWAHGLLLRIIRVPCTLDKFFRPLHLHFPWDWYEDCRMPVVAIAFT
jgi:hypothetical protein